MARRKLLSRQTYIAAVLAYAIGNQTIAQRLFAVRPDKIKATFVTATVGYGATVIGIGMLGVSGWLGGELVYVHGVAVEQTSDSSIRKDHHRVA